MRGVMNGSTAWNMLPGPYSLGIATSRAMLNSTNRIGSSWRVRKAAAVKNATCDRNVISAAADSSPSGAISAA